jgi:hypothetical protein
MGVHLLAGARWGAIPRFVSEFSVVGGSVVGFQRIVGCVAAAVTALRPVADTGLRAAGVMPAVRQPGA